MRGTLLLGFALSMVAESGFAADCGTWTSGMEDAEGGKAMVARVCNAAGGRLAVYCGDSGKFAISFIPTASDFPPPQGNPDFAGVLTIRAGNAAFDRTMTYWAMEGAMGDDVAFADPLIAAMGKADTITFAAPVYGIAETRFSLAGAANALKKLKAKCPRA